MINAVTDVQEDTVVEVVVSAQQLSEDDVEIRPHVLSIHSYKTPTFCNFCGEMLFGMFKQVRWGYICYVQRLKQSIPRHHTLHYGNIYVYAKKIIW